MFPLLHSIIPAHFPSLSQVLLISQFKIHMHSQALFVRGGFHSALRYVLKVPRCKPLVTFFNGLFNGHFPQKATYIAVSVIPQLPSVDKAPRY